MVVAAGLVVVAWLQYWLSWLWWVVGIAISGFGLGFMVATVFGFLVVVVVGFGLLVVVLTNLVDVTSFGGLDLKLNSNH